MCRLKEPILIFLRPLLATHEAAFQPAHLRLTKKCLRDIVRLISVLINFFVNRFQDDGQISECPTDLTKWAIRLPFSTIWTFGHRLKIICQKGFYEGSFTAKGSDVTYGPGGQILEPKDKGSP
jgi:hypothetical protein